MAGDIPPVRRQAPKPQRDLPAMRDYFLVVRAQINGEFLIDE